MAAITREFSKTEQIMNFENALFYASKSSESPEALKTKTKEVFQQHVTDPTLRNEFFGAYYEACKTAGDDLKSWEWNGGEIHFGENPERLEIAINKVNTKNLVF